MKPDLQIILKIIIEPNLHNHSFCFNNNGVTYELKITTIVADKPARAMLLNMQYFNAKFGCVFCLSNIQTEIIDRQKHIFITFNNNYLASFRSSAGTLYTTFGVKATKSPKYLIKGFSFFLKILAQSILLNQIVLILCIAFV